MKNIVEHICNKEYDAANEALTEELHNIMRNKLFEEKKRYAAKMCGDSVEEGLLDVMKQKLRMKSPSERANGKKPPDRLEENEDEQLDEARINIVKIRVRGGQVQRRKKVSNVTGMTFRGGSLKRMSPAERRRRKLGAIRAARKTKTKKVQILRKRKLSIMKRKRMGG
jgi:hypothetical protein